MSLTDACGPHCGTDDKGTRHCGHCHPVKTRPDDRVMLSLAQLDDMLDRQVRVRVWDGPHSSVRAEGLMIGYCDVPTILVRGDDGVIRHESTRLPIEELPPS